MAAPNVNPPATPGTPLVDQKGNVTGAWYTFFVTLWQRTGGAVPSSQASQLLDTITNAVGSLLYRGAAAWQGLAAGAQYKVLRMGAATPEWDTLDGNSFGSQTKNTFFLAPSAANGNPSFRAVASSDLANVAGQYPGTKTNDNAAAGNIGEYIASTVQSGSAIPLTSATSADITSITLTPGDWDVWGSVTTAPAATTTQSNIIAWTSSVSATYPGPPNNGGLSQLQVAIGSSETQTLPVGAQRISIAANETIYLSANVTFATSTLSAYGFLGARRLR